MTKLLWLAVVAAAFIPGIASADNAASTSSSQPPPAPSPWKGSVALGYLRTTGNTNSTSANFKTALDWHVAPWENLFGAQAIFAKSNGVSSAESYQAGDQLNYDFTATYYVFGNLNYLSDRFASVVERYTETVGVGRHVFNTPTQKLDLQVGVGANQQREAGQQNLKTQAVVVFDGTYVYNISSSSQFKQTLHVETGRLNTYVNPVSQLKLTIVGNLYASLDYEVRYNTSAPPSTIHTDTITSVNIGYSFGHK